MILEPGQLGIVAIRNNNTEEGRQMIMVYKGMDIKGVPTIKRMLDMKQEKYASIARKVKSSSDAYVVQLGYNENIFVETKQDAINLFKIINAIFVSGEDAEKAIEDISDIFFQEAA